MWWIRMPSITGESRRFTDLVTFSLSLTTPLKLSMLFLSPARRMWLSWMVLRRRPGLRNTSLHAFAMFGPPSDVSAQVLRPARRRPRFVGGRMSAVFLVGASWTAI